MNAVIQNTGVERRIYAMLRGQIEAGVMPENAKLPSTRALAAELGVSRTTVTAAYEQLVAEGFVMTSAGKVARVASPLHTTRHTTRSTDGLVKPQAPVLSSYGQRVATFQGYTIATPQARIDFRYGAVASSDFPALGWQRTYRAEMAKPQKDLNYKQPEGELRLRVALQGYLRRTRGLACDAEQILIVHGSQQGLDLCARLLLDPEDRFVFEEPGYRMARYSFEAMGAHALPMPVDAAGMDTANLPSAARMRVAFVTPSHQFPMGGVLPMARRTQLLQWANHHGAWIIEDDYGGEFRYGQRPVDALQAMDTQGRVIYVGSFSKALSPQLRLGYLVLPKALVAVFRECKRLADRHTPLLEQNVLASLIESGAYERHVRRLRRTNVHRRKALIDAVEQHFGNTAQLVGTAAGLHGVLLLPQLDAQGELALQARVRQQGVGVYPLSPLYALPEPTEAEAPRPTGLILGYAGLTQSEIQEGIAIVAAAAKMHG